MKVALLGATGFVGSALLKEALDRGHMVTTIVRHPEKLEKREGLAAKAGDVYDTSSLAKLIIGNDAVISAFNPGWKNPNLYDDQVRGTASIIAAIKDATLAGEPITAKLTRAPGNNAAIGGLKVMAMNGWFAARPSGTENIYKIYAESFLSQTHLNEIVREAQAMVNRALQGA